MVQNKLNQKLRIMNLKLKQMTKSGGDYIADEVWNMLPDVCKKIMGDIEISFKESIKADVNHMIIDKAKKMVSIITKLN